VGMLEWSDRGCGGSFLRTGNLIRTFKHVQSVERKISFRMTNSLKALLAYVTACCHAPEWMTAREDTSKQRSATGDR
jgi:hypothetical protein